MHNTPHMRPHSPIAIVLILLVAAGGCRSAQTTSRPTPPAAPAAAAVLPNDIRWVRASAEYQAAVLQTYRAATARVEAAARGREAGTWAVVLDADETVINNVVYQIERARVRQPFTAESWRAWVARREATPLAGAAAFLQRVRELGGRIAIVTNRLQSECPDTEAVFKTRELLYDVMLCRPDDGPSDKNPRFRAVAEGTTHAGARPLQVIAYLGDNIQDFPSLTQKSAAGDVTLLTHFGDTYFILPNPMYGSWQ